MSEAEVDIAETIDRLEEIAETLEDGEVDLTTAKSSARRQTDILRSFVRRWTSATVTLLRSTVRTPN